jgi:hypothetical protein
MKSSTIRAALVAALTLSPLGCTDAIQHQDDLGGGLPDAGVPSSSGVDPAAQVTALSATDLGTFCQWSVAYQGGAGTTYQCASGPVTVRDANHCVQIYSGRTCDLTVAQAEACVRELTVDPCNGGSSSACAPVIACALL